MRPERERERERERVAPFLVLHFAFLVYLFAVLEREINEESVARLTVQKLCVSSHSLSL